LLYLPYLKRHYILVAFFFISHLTVSIVYMYSSSFPIRYFCLIIMLSLLHLWRDVLLLELNRKMDYICLLLSFLVIPQTIGFLVIPQTIGNYCLRFFLFMQYFKLFILCSLWLQILESRLITLTRLCFKPDKIGYFNSSLLLSSNLHQVWYLSVVNALFYNCIMMTYKLP
jgi:hypothetical protein